MGIESVVAIVPARHYSQRVPGKNYRLLGQYPLYYHILSTLEQVPSIKQIIVDTDSQIIISGVKKMFPQIVILERPKELSAPEISMNQILLSIVERANLDSDTLIFQTHVTNPFLKSETIEKMINNYQENIDSDIETMMMVTEARKRLWTEAGRAINHDPMKLLQTQDLGATYEENSCGYLFSVKDLVKNGNRLGTKQSFYPIAHSNEALDIDTEEDFQLAEAWNCHRTQVEIKSSSDAPKVHTDEEIYEEMKKMSDKIFKERELENGYFSKFRVLISAPYMMPNIGAFIRFFEEELGMKTIVAPVKERLSEEELLRYSGQYDLSLIGDDRYTEKVLKESGVTVISKWGTGIDSIDQVACKKYNIQLRNTLDAFSIPVAESIISAILGFIRQTYNSTNQMSYTDNWTKLPCRTLAEITVGIIGFGNVGKKTAELLEAMGTKKILVTDLDKSKTNRFDDENNVICAGDQTEILLYSDVVCVCCDFREGNYHLIGDYELFLMKEGSYLINMARGGLVDLSALEKSLLSGHLAGAALDVFEIEPLPHDSVLRRMSNVLLSSHNANSSPKHWMKVHLNTIKQGLEVLLEKN